MYGLYDDRRTGDDVCTTDGARCMMYGTDAVSRTMTVVRCTMTMMMMGMRVCRVRARVMSCRDGRDVDDGCARCQVMMRVRGGCVGAGMSDDDDARHAWCMCGRRAGVGALYDCMYGTTTVSTGVARVCDRRTTVRR